MIEIKVLKTFSEEAVMNEDQIELFVTNEIGITMQNKITKALENMSFTDMNYNDEDKTFDIEGTIILCTEQDIATTAEMQAQLMAKAGMSKDEIFEVLSLGLNNTEGF